MKQVLMLLVSLSIFSSSMLKAGEERLVHEGRTLIGHLELADGKALSDGVILMTHGTLAHGRMEIMSTLQRLFKQTGLNSLSITLSLDQNERRQMYDCKARHTHQHTDAMTEIGLWLDWLKRRDSGPVVLLGHSRGGNQTAWFASEHGNDLVSKVILIAPATWDAGEVAQSYQNRYKKPLADVYRRAQKLVENGKGDTLLQGVDFIYCEDTSVSAEAFVSYYQDDERKHTPHLLNKINKPTLVFAGSEDTVVTGLTEAVQSMADGEQIRLSVIEGADHFFRDLYAEDMVDEIVEFLGN
ncbi:MAG: alpha/beta hydrolase [Gammaproteobacteria bacterium]|nr:alpha/beta hydrolase [Gammaproteobacteria bacterium]